MPLSMIEKELANILHKNNVDKINIAGIILDIRKNKVDIERYLSFIKKQEGLTIEVATDKLMEMEGY